jgi:hypothetical protein
MSDQTKATVQTPEQFMQGGGSLAANFMASGFKANALKIFVQPVWCIISEVWERLCLVMKKPAISPRLM